MYHSSLTYILPHKSKKIQVS